MASQLDHLKDILTRNGIVHLPNTLPRLTMPKLRQSAHYAALKESYLELGGLKADLPFDTNPYFLELFNKAVVIDDSIHFNAYRSKTLSCSIYTQHLLNFPLQNYKRYCRQHQNNCLMAASRNELWTNSIAERHFGESDAFGDLGIYGAAAWKLRAMYDLITDATTLLLPYEVIRISLYDTILVGGKLTPIKDLLLSRKEENEKAIYNFFARKLGLVKQNIDQFMKEELSKMNKEEPDQL